MATETFYILEDGTNGDPRDIAPDAKGMLHHKDGRAVAYAAHGPRSRSVDPAKERAKAAAAAKTRDMRPADDRRPYTTRDVKAG